MYRKTGYKDKNGTEIRENDLVEILSKKQRLVACMDYGEPELVIQEGCGGAILALSSLDSNDLLVITAEMKAAEAQKFKDELKKQIEEKEAQGIKRIAEVLDACKKYDISNSCVVMYHSVFCDLKKHLCPIDSYKEGRIEIAHGKLDGINIYIDERFCDEHGGQKIVITDEEEYKKYCDTIRSRREWYE